MGLTIGVDLGGTKIAVGVVDEKGRILVESRRPTPMRDPDAVEKRIVKMVNKMVLQHPDRGGGDRRGRVHRRDPLPCPVRAEPRLARGTAAAWPSRPAPGCPPWSRTTRTPRPGGSTGSAPVGGCEHLVVVTVGTGIGGGIVMAGSILRGACGVAAEIGHLRLVPDGLPCGCGQRGCWEQYGSGNALVRTARALAAERRPEAATLLALGDGTPEGVEGLHVTAAARDGDPVALAAFDRTGQALGEGMAMLAAVLDPAGFVIGGGVSEAGDLLLAPARRAYLDSLTGREHRTPAEMRLATLGNEAGLIGAADLARTR